MYYMYIIISLITFHRSESITFIKKSIEVKLIHLKQYFINIYKASNIYLFDFLFKLLYLLFSLNTVNFIS